MKNAQSNTRIGFPHGQIRMYAQYHWLIDEESYPLSRNIPSFRFNPSASSGCPLFPDRKFSVRGKLTVSVRASEEFPRWKVAAGFQNWLSTGQYRRGETVWNSRRCRWKQNPFRKRTNLGKTGSGFTVDESNRFDPRLLTGFTLDVAWNVLGICIDPTVFDSIRFDPVRVHINRIFHAVCRRMYELLIFATWSVL